jgi:hypothetical protein
MKVMFVSYRFTGVDKQSIEELLRWQDCDELARVIAGADLVAVKRRV